MAEVEEVPEHRCGFELTPEDLRVGWDVDLSEWRDRIKAVSCCREAWRDFERCIWHAEVEDKPVDGLKLARADGPERIDGAYLAGVDAGNELPFQGCDLLFADFTNANFLGGCFDGTTLDYAQFSDSDFRDAQFSAALLRETRFSDADFRGAEFPDADLSGAEFPDANFSVAEFPDADLREAQFPTTRLWRVQFSNVNLRRATFSEADLWEAQFPDADLRGARFPNATLWEAQFPEANLRRAEFPEADLRQAQFSDAHLEFSKFPGAHLRAAQFPNAELPQAQFPNSELPQAQFPDAFLYDTQFPATNLRGARFPAADLTQARLEDADAQDACFKGANLQKTDIRKIDLRGATLHNAHLDQTVFSDTRIDATTDFGDSPDEWGPTCVYETHPEVTEPPGDRSHWEAAEWVYRRLQKLHEENALSEEARGFHVRKEEVRRQQQKQKLTEAREQLSEDLADNDAEEAYESLIEMLRRDTRYSVSTLQWHLTRHGESIRQIFVSAGVLVLACGLLYPFVGGFESSSTDTAYRIPLTEVYQVVSLDGIATLLQGIYFSIITFTTIGYGDLYPTGVGSKVLVGFESLAGAILIALFVFVLGRQVAR
jgi:uncharacterized protein YjbI with pentapeptide repeats